MPGKMSDLTVAEQVNEERRTDSKITKLRAAKLRHVRRRIAGYARYPLYTPRNISSFSCL